MQYMLIFAGNTCHHFTRFFFGVLEESVQKCLEKRLSIDIKPLNYDVWKLQQRFNRNTRVVNGVSWFPYCNRYSGI